MLDIQLLIFSNMVVFRDFSLDWYLNIQLPFPVKKIIQILKILLSDWIDFLCTLREADF